MAPKWLLSVFVLVSVTNAEILHVNDHDTVLQYRSDFNCSLTWEILPENNGLGVILMVNSTNLDSDDGDYLLFSADGSMLGESESVVYLTGALTDVWLAIPLVEKAYLEFSANNCTEDKDVTLTLKQYELRAPEPPVTTPNPFPPSGIETEIVVHLTGKTADQYDDPDFIRLFQKHIQNATYAFCDDKKIFYNSSKSENETVFIRNPHMCSDEWPDYKNCVQFLLAIYVTNPRAEYELSVSHLKEFWSGIEKDGLPSSLGVQPYEFPNVALQILYWLGWLLLAIVVTGIIAFVLWRVEINAFNKKRRFLDEEEERRKESIFRNVDLRNKNVKPLKPAKHQKIPEFMKSNHDSVSKAATAPTTKRIFLKNFFTRNEESKVDKVEPPPSPSSSPVTPVPTRFIQQLSLDEMNEC